jgi:hypothetical protein
MANEILPVEAAPETLEALPHFSQMKIAPAAQPSAGLPQRLTLEAIYVLGHPAAADGAIRIESLSQQETALTPARHTVAARLFAPDFLAQHLEFCAVTAALLPVQRLNFPRSHEILPEVGKVIKSNLALSRKQPLTDIRPEGKL